MKSNDLGKLYYQFTERYKIANPAPRQRGRDLHLYVLVMVVIVGSFLLSGSRTGNAVSKLATLSELFSHVGYLGLNSDWFVFFEGFLAFLTFEAGILLSGILLSRNLTLKGNIEFWYYVLLFTSLFPALLANLLPGWELIENLFGFQVGEVVVVGGQEQTER